MEEVLGRIAAEAIEKGTIFLNDTKEIMVVEIPEVLSDISIEKASEVLSSMIKDIAQSTGDYFGIEDLSVIEGDTIEFNTESDTAYHGDTFKYNLNILKDLKCTSPEDVNKICTKKFATRFLENKYQDTTTKELASHFLTGVRTQMLGLRSGNYEQMLSKLPADDTLPAQLKLRAMEYGRNVYADLLGIGSKPTFQKCLEEFNSSSFSRITIKEALLSDDQSVKPFVQPTFTGLHPQHVAYGIHKLSELPEVKQYIDGCKSAFADTLSITMEKMECFFSEIYDNVKTFFTLQEIDAKAIAKLGDTFVEQREYGLDKCSEAAKNIFNPGVIENWSTLSLGQRKEIAGIYAAEVANAFELKKYIGIYFEDLEKGVGGYNNGDGSIHLSNSIIEAWTSPFEIINTITHELRHQYQSEALQNLHHVAKSVLKEWSIAQQIYNYDQPNCYDPWGYTYNPLEIDARYAGETVVRNITKDMFNA